MLAIRVGHRHQALHRPLDRDLAPPHVLLDRRRQRLHQRQATRHPAAASAQTPRQLLAAPPLTPLELTQQPPHLQRRFLRAAQAVAEDQSLLLADPQHQGLDRVPPQTFERADSPVAVDDPEPLRLPARRHHHDRHLLPVLLQRAQQSPLARRVANPQPLVVQVELVELQIHGLGLCLGPPSASDEPGSTALGRLETSIRQLATGLAGDLGPIRHNSRKINHLDSPLVFTASDSQNRYNSCRFRRLSPLLVLSGLAPNSAPYS